VIKATGKGIDDFEKGWGNAVAKRMPGISLARRRRAVAVAVAKRKVRRR
jgi:hypothetical protein